MITISQNQIQSFRRKIWRFYEKHGRDLPFRNITNPYRVTVSEFMLQQTQVERVIPKYRAWISAWPSWRALSNATNREALSAWSGLGYNRRALYLRDMARELNEKFHGRLPREIEALKRFSGIGEYSARAILIFSDNAPLAAVDTNIRQVILSEFDLPADLSETKLAGFAARILPKNRSRDWHYALMDYGRLGMSAEQKRRISKPRQSRFAGSRRQIRGEIIRRLTYQESVEINTVAQALNQSAEAVQQAAQALSEERLIVMTGKRAVLRLK